MIKKLFNFQLCRLTVIIVCLFGGALNAVAFTTVTSGNETFFNISENDTETVNDRSAISYLSHIWSKQPVAAKTASESTAPFAVWREWKVQDSPASCGPFPGSAVFFRNVVGCGHSSYETWHAYSDLRLTEYTNGTAVLRGRLHNNGRIAQITINMSGKTGSGSTWPNPCYQNRIRGQYYYSNFSGSVNEGGRSYSIRKDQNNKPFIMGTNAGNDGSGKMGFGMWNDGWGKRCNEVFGVLLPYNPCSVNAGPDKTICAGDSVTLTATGTGSFRWSTGETSRTIRVSPTTRTRYSVTATSGSCSKTDYVYVNVLNVTAQAGPDKTICGGTSTTLTASGGGTYLWSTGERTATITVSPNQSTTYTVTVSNGSCQDSDSVRVNVLEQVHADAGPDKLICDDKDSTTLTASGGGTYLWSTGETTATITVSPTQTTTYSVVVTKGSCQDTDTVTVTVSSLQVDLGNDVSLCGDASKTLTARIVSNTITAPCTDQVTYEWKKDDQVIAGATGQTLSVTMPGVYSVTARNCNGCTASDLILVRPSFEVDLGSNAVICADEEVTLTPQVSGYTGCDTGENVSYLWSTGATTPTITVSTSGTYSVTVTGCDNQCSITDEVVVTVKEEIDANAGSDVVICYGENTVLTATGGGTYLWSTGETTSTITVNPTETTTYSVTVTANGCTATDEVVVTVKPRINANAGDDVIACYAEDTVLTATGGGTYLWSTGETTSSITVNPTETTTYTVAVTVDGCTVTDEVVVTVKPRVEANAGADVTVCYAEDTVLTATGGGTYLWSTGETTPSITVNLMETTTFTVAVTVDGCTVTDEVVVTVKPEIDANAGSDVVICYGENTVLTATGGGTYLWSTGETTSTITVNPTETTTYTVAVTVDGCTVTDEVVVTVKPRINANAGADVTVCYAEDTVLTATGGGTYLWSTGETTPTITVNLMETTTLTVAVTVDGCTVTDEVVVTVRPQIEVMASADVTICEAEDTVLTATGDEGTYLWSTGETTSSITVNPSVTTTYTVSLTKDGCTVSDSVVVNVDRKVTIGDYVWTDENRNGVQDANETGVNGVTATLYHCDGTQVATTTTANNAAGEAGAYNFRVCPDSGFYYVVFSDIPDGLEFTQRNMGLDDAVDSDANQNGQTQCFEVEREDIPTIDAGLVEICQISVDAGNDIRICPGETIMITADVEDETAECPGGCQYPITTRDRCFGPAGDFEIFLVSTANAGGDYDNFKFKASTQSFQKLSNGSARYTATASNGTDVITIDALLTGNTTIAPVGSPNLNSCQDFDTSSWEYWTTWSGTINSQNHGVFNLSVKGSAFQLGVGADVVRTGLGASGWFYVTGGDGFYTNGDVNIPLEECVEQNVSYVWSTVDGEIVGNPNQKTISINKAGTYVVTVENCIDCEATDTIIVTRKFCYTESKGPRPSRIKNVYPIPVKAGGILTVELHREEAPDTDGSLTAISLKGSADFVDRKEDIQVALYDITGRMIGVPKSFVMENGNVTIHFSLDHIQAGSYILRTQGGTWSDSKNIIVE